MSVQNESGRSAGLSNQVQVPAAPTLPPPDHFRAEVESDGVLLSWDCPPALAASGVITHKIRIYRREQGKQTDAKVSDVELDGLFADYIRSARKGFLTRLSSGKSITTTAPRS